MARSFYGLALIVAVSGCGKVSNAADASVGEDGPPCTPADETCNGEDDDCDGTVDEEPTECAAAGALTACGASGCEIAGCQSGLDDCDDAEPDCETDVSFSRYQCGSCTGTCTGAEELCRGGSCEEIAPAWSFTVETSSSALTEVATDDAGRVIVAGTYGGVGSAGDEELDSLEGSDAIVASLDPATGEPLWVRTFGGPTDVTVRDAALGSDILYVAGTHTDPFDFGDTTSQTEAGTSVYIASYAAEDGAERWVISFTASSDLITPLTFFRSMTADSDGNVYINLGFRGILRRDGDFVATNQEACEGLLTSLDPSGALRFSRRYDWCRGADAMALDSSETELHLVGNMEGGATLDDRTFPGDIRGLRAVFSASNGSLVRAFQNGDGGQDPQCPSEEEFDVVAFSPDPDGGAPTLWVGLYCDGDADYGGGLVEGDSILVGYDASDDAHRHSFQVAEVGGGPDALAFGEGLLVTGGFVRPPADLGLGTLGVSGGVDAFVAAYQADGTIEWGAVFGGGENDLVRDVAVGDGRAVFAVGTFSETFSFGDETFTTAERNTRGFALRIDN